MDHVAIMKKSWGLIPKILDGRKTIESRWSINRVAPWGKVKVGDNIFFRNSGEKVAIKANISKVLAFDNLTPKKVKNIIDKFGDEGKICFSNKKESYEWAKNKKYCTLIFLKNVEEIEPFKINKAGYGIGCAWMCVENISSVKM